MSIFDPSEIYKFAIRIEDNGEKFYRKYAETLSEEKVKDLFTQLADDEVSHKKKFEDILSGIEESEPSESYPGEYLEYVIAYVDNLVFKEEKLKSEIEKISDAKAAIDFALQREFDSIHYYQEIKKLVPEQTTDLIDKIIDEERKHVVKLTKISL